MNIVVCTCCVVAIDGSVTCPYCPPPASILVELLMHPKPCVVLKHSFRIIKDVSEAMDLSAAPRRKGKQPRVDPAAVVPDDTETTTAVQSFMEMQRIEQMARNATRLSQLGLI